MESPSRDARGVWHPRNDAEVQWLVQHARARGAVLRVRGSGHSTAGAIGLGAVEAGSEVVAVCLDRMRSVRFDHDAMQVTVQAGCNLGHDFRDPTGRSTLENSLCAQLDARGWALPNLGGIAHQTVGGMLMTGSSGGSVQHDFGNSLVGLRLVDGTGALHALTPSDGDRFDAAGVSMGLLGIVVEVTLQCEPRYDIAGDLTAFGFDDTPFDMMGTGEGSLEGFLRHTPYARIEWWPQHGIDRVVVWKAHRMRPADYNEITGPPEALNRERFLPFVETGPSSVPVQAAGGVFMSFFAAWNPVERRLARGGSGAQRVRRIMGGLYEGFVHSPDAPPTPFRDGWFPGLPMDDALDDRALPMSFGELWLPLEHTGEAVRRLREAYLSGGADSHNLMACEIYAAGPSRFLMSQGHDRPSVRLNWYWYDRQDVSVTDWMAEKYQLFEDLEPRLHWGKVLPSDPRWISRVVRPNMKGWSAFEQARQELDPDGLFLTPYWAGHLGLQPVEALPHVPTPPQSIDFLPPSAGRRSLLFSCGGEPALAVSSSRTLPLDPKGVVAVASALDTLGDWWPELASVELLSGEGTADDAVVLVTRADRHAARLHVARSDHGWTLHADATSHANLSGLAVTLRWDALEWGGVTVTLDVGVSLRLAGPAERLLRPALTRHLARALESLERYLHVGPPPDAREDSPLGPILPEVSVLRSVLRGSRDATPLLDKFGEERPFSLSTGRTIMMPERVTLASALGLLGPMDLAKANAVAAPYGLSAVPLSPSTGFGGVFVIDYEEATFGQYQEALFMMAVRPGRASKRSLLKLPVTLLDLASTYAPSLSRGSQRKGGFLLWKLYVNQPEVTALAREVWQADIEERPVEVGTHGDQRSIRVGGSDGKNILDARWGSGAAGRHPVEMDMLTYMTRPGPPRASQTLIRGAGETGLFQGEFSIDSSDDFAQGLRDVGWAPKVWQHFTDFQAVFFEDRA